MILGYEQPVDIPVMSIYDKDMMRMYLGALQKDYEQGIADQKEFNKTFGDFYSLSAADNENWYNLTMRPIAEFLEKNPNAARSIEGRAQLSRLRNNINMGDLALLRQSAKTMDEFNKARQAMIANGKYSQDMADFLNENPYNYDTLSQKTPWSKVAPSQYNTIQDMLLPTIRSLKNAYTLDMEASKNPENRGYNVYNVSEKQVKDAINSQYGDLLKLPAMQYHLNQSGLDEDKFKDMLAAQVKSQLEEKRVFDQVWAADQQRNMQIMQMKQHAAEKAADRANALLIAGMKNDKNKKQMQLTDKIEQRTAEKQEGQSAAIFARYFDNLSRQTNNKNHKKKYEQYRNEWLSYNNMTTDEKRSFLKKYGYIDNKGRYTKKYQDYYAKASSITAGNKIQTRQQTHNNAYDIYSSYLSGLTGLERDAAIKELSGNYQRQKNGYYQVSFGNNIEYTKSRAFNVAGGKSLKGSIGNKDVALRFGKWLSKPGSSVTGNLFDTSEIKAGMLPGNVLEISGAKVTVPLEKIENFLNIARTNGYFLSNGKHCKNASDAEILADLGLSVVNRTGDDYVSIRETLNSNGSIKNSSKSYKQYNAYVKIPVSKTIQSEGTNLSGINDYYNKTVYGGAKAYEESQNATIAAETFSIK